MELSDYAQSGTWDLIEAPAEIRMIQSADPPYQNRTEMVFYMGLFLICFLSIVSTLFVFLFF